MFVRMNSYILEIIRVRSIKFGENDLQQWKQVNKVLDFSHAFLRSRKSLIVHCTIIISIQTILEYLRNNFSEITDKASFQFGKVR